MKNYYPFEEISIPTEILSNPNLTPNAKILYGVILKFSDNLKCCNVTNRQFSQMLSVNPTTISTLISSLRSEHYIITTQNDVGFGFKERHIYIK